MRQILKLLFMVVATIYISACEMEISPSDKSVQPGTAQRKNSLTPFPSSPENLTSPFNWWIFTPRSVASTNYATSFSADALNWYISSPTGALQLWPDWIKTIQLNGEILLFYHYNGNFYLNRTADGLTWQTPQVISGLERRLTSDGFYVYPEIAAINNEVYSFRIETSPILHVSVLQNLTFTMLTTHDLNTTNYALSPSYAFLNGKHYLIFRRHTINAGLWWVESTDLLTWSEPAPFGLPLMIFVDGQAIDATTLNNNICVSVRNPDYSMSIIKFDGTSYTYTASKIYFNNSLVKTKSINIPIDTDGSKLVVSFRGNGDNDKNYIVYSNDEGATWIILTLPSSSAYNRTRELLFTGS